MGGDRPARDAAKRRKSFKESSDEDDDDEIDEEDDDDYGGEESDSGEKKGARGRRFVSGPSLFGIFCFYPSSAAAPTFRNGNAPPPRRSLVNASVPFLQMHW